MQHNIHRHDNIKTYYTYIQNNIDIYVYNDTYNIKLCTYTYVHNKITGYMKIIIKIYI